MEPLSLEKVLTSARRFAMKLAREFGRPDWRAMLAEMSSREWLEWGSFIRNTILWMN